MKINNQDIESNDEYEKMKNKMKQDGICQEDIEMVIEQIKKLREKKNTE